MKKRRGMPHKPRGDRRPIQVFTCGPFEFHIDKALKLAREGRQPERRWPNPDWVGPLIEINEEYIEQTDLCQPILFATIITDGEPWQLLIDGNHRVLKALRHSAQVEVITLNLADTLKIIRGPAHAVEQMRLEGARLGLLP